jgi:hypothetical protein
MIFFFLCLSPSVDIGRRLFFFFLSSGLHSVLFDLLHSVLFDLCDAAMSVQFAWIGVAA